jgi:anti-anti-sigma regulatory factor/HAMP domain-containing protein
MKLRLTLRYKLALAFALVVIVPLGTVGILGYVTSRSLARQLTLREALSTAALGNEFVHLYVGHAREMIAAAARRPAFASPVEAGQWDETTPALTALQQDSVIFEAIWLVDPNGIRRATSWPDKSEVGMDLSGRDYFRGAMRTDQPYVSAPYASSRTGEPMVGIAVPLHDAQGQVRAVLVGGLPLTQVSDTIASVRLGESGHAVLMDSAGVIIAHPNQGQYGVEPLTKGTSPLLNAALAGGETGTTEAINEHGEQALAGWVTVPDLGWKVVVQQPLAEAYAIVEPQDRIMIPVRILSVALGVAVGLFLAATIARPVRQAAIAARALATGDYSQRVPSGGEDEIGELAESFNIMAARVGELTGQLRDTIESLLTPAISLRQGLLAMPLVGAIDTARARQITDTLLQEIVRQRARVAILDISGVPTVDTAVAKHLSETIAAARLLGVCVIVSGISPRVARTLVELGVEWEGVQTVHNMGQAMEMAQEALR